MPIDLSPSKARATAVTGGVAIVSFPQLLMTREFGDPDTLFMPLLKARAKRWRPAKAWLPAGTGVRWQA